MTVDALDPLILGPAFVAGLLVLATHVPLGQQVLARGIVFIDLAIAQVAGLGATAAIAPGCEPRGLAERLAALGAALAGALLLTFTEKRWPDIQEALIGALFVLAACAGLLLLANNPHGGEHLKDLLVGQILWVNYGQLASTAALAAVLLAFWFGAGARLGRVGFYTMFAVAVTASVQLVGIYLVFASLIVPALATRRLTGGSQLLWGYATGITGYAAGILASALFDFPTGAITVWTLATAAAGTAWLVGRRRDR